MGGSDHRQGKIEEAYALYEQGILAGFNEISNSLHGIECLALEENNIVKAKMVVEKQINLAKLLEMGKYMEASSELYLAIYKKEKETALMCLSEIIHNIKNITSYKNSELYSHMKFTEYHPGHNLFMIQKALESDESINFLRDEKDFHILMEKLKSLMSEKAEGTAAEI